MSQSNVVQKSKKTKGSIPLSQLQMSEANPMLREANQEAHSIINEANVVATSPPLEESEASTKTVKPRNRRSNGKTERKRSPSPKTTSTKGKKKTVNDHEALSFKPINVVPEDTKKEPVKPKKTKEILYEELFEAANFFTNDDFWKTYFLDLSKGKCKKIYVDATTVSYTFKRNSFTYVYKGKKPEDIAVELKRMINNTCYIFSDTDMISEEQEIGLIANEFNDMKKEDNWKKIRNRKMKDHLITRFVIDQKEKHDLTWEETRHAYNVINNALFLFYTHNGDDITMENGDMTGLDDVIISKKRICNERLTDENLNVEKPQVKKINLDKEWSKCINGIFKQMNSFLSKDNTVTVPKVVASKGKKRKTKASEEEKKILEKSIIEMEDDDVEFAFQGGEEGEGETSGIATINRVDDAGDYLQDSDEEQTYEED